MLLQKATLENVCLEETVTVLLNKIRTKVWQPCQ